MRKLLLGFMIASLGVLSDLGDVRADWFSFSYAFAGFNGQGTLSAVANGNGSFTAVSGVGTNNGIPISLVPNPAAPGVGFFDIYGYDNQLFPGSDPVINGAGLLFQGTNLLINIGSLAPGVYYYIDSPGGRAPATHFVQPGMFTLSQIPEPSTLLLLSLGLVLGLLVRRVDLTLPLTGSSKF